MRKKLIFPKGGGRQWFHICGLLQLKEVIEFVKDWSEVSNISVISVSRKEIRSWRLTSKRKARAFVGYIRNNVESKDLRIRLKQRKPWDLS